MMQTVWSRLSTLLKVIVFFIFSQQSAHANVSLVTDSNGILFGANGVVVDDFIYNVRFQDGSWPDLGLSVLFSIEQPEPSQATRANKALIDTVFTGIYDTNPALTNGCLDPTGCLILTPRLSFFNGSQVRAVANVAYNAGGTGVDTFDTSFQFNFNADTSINVPGALGPVLVWAVWSKVGPVTPVPEPHHYALLLAGIGIVLAKRKHAV